MKNEPKTLVDKKDYDDNEVDWYFHKIVNNLTWILSNYDIGTNKIKEFHIGNYKITKDDRIKACINYFENAKEYVIYKELSDFSLDLLSKLKEGKAINLEEILDTLDKLVSEVCKENKYRQINGTYP